MLNENLYKKFNPPNLTPNHFLAPPTDILCAAFTKGVRKVTDEIIENTRRPWTTFGKTQCLFGTELEILFFPPDFDPENNDRNCHQNPCYGDDHLDKVRETCADINNGSLLPNITDADRISRIGIEIRTPPGELADYYTHIEIVRTKLAERCQIDNVRPVVHSQHLHVSVFRGWKNLIESRNDDEDYRCTQAEFNNTSPTQLLPEEFAYGIHARPFQFKGSKDDGQSADPLRLEFRRLSSEFACDTHLNLLITLLGTHHFLKTSESHLSGFSKTPSSFEDGLEAMKTRQHTLRSVLGEEINQKLLHILGYYSDVSTRLITLDEVNQAVCCAQTTPTIL